MPILRPGLLVAALLVVTVTPSSAWGAARHPAYKVSATATASTVSAGGTVTVVGKVSPKAAKQKLALQRFVGTRWTTVATAKTNKRSRYGVATTLSATASLRVSVAGHGRLRAGHSRALVVTVSKPAPAPTPTAPTAPTAPSTTVPTSWLAVDAGEDHTCGISTDRTLWCWGTNSFGELGRAANTTTNQTPTQVSTAQWSSVDVGGYSTCAVRTDATAWCWGRNSDGQLGPDAATGSSPNPTPVQVPGTWSALSLGWVHTCGIKTDGSAWCWGDDSQGELGPTATASSGTPVAIGTGSWISIASGGYFSCAVKSDHTAWCWGKSDHGQTGTSSGSALHQVDAATTWTSVSTGFAHVCGLRSTGTAWCWGYNHNGQLGQGSSFTDLSTPTQVGAGATWASLGTGDFHTCGVTTGGVLSCWGLNGNGQLGSSTNSGSNTAVNGNPVTVGDAAGWTSVSGGSDHTCGLRSGVALRWGENLSGQLGNNNASGGYPPVVVGTRFA